MIDRRIFTMAAAAAVATPLLSAPPPARAQTRTVRLLVGFPPGGSADTLARLLAERLRTTLGANVVVDNKAGAVGRIALGELKRAAPDGQTLMLTPSGPLVVLPWLYPTSLGYDPVRDFTPVAPVATFDFAITAGPSAPKGELRAVLAALKAEPAKASFGTPGAGSLPHFTGLLLAQGAATPLTHVPYKGAAPAVQDLLGGQIPLVIDTPLETIEHHRAGRVRILAVSGEARSAALPDVPTLREAGLDIVADGFFGVYGPPGMPPDVVAPIERAVAEALRAPELAERIRSLGLAPAPGAGAALARVQAAHLRRWEEPIRASGFRPE